MHCISVPATTPHLPPLPVPFSTHRSFDTKDGEWQDISLPFNEFIPTFRARTVRDGSKLDPSKICSVQLMLSKFEYGAWPRHGVCVC